jgi:hypothetical protein
MNVPPYAVALIVFAVLFLQLSVFLLVTLAVTLAAMATVLALQVLLQKPSTTEVRPQTDPDPGRAEARVKARRSSKIDLEISFTFIAATWAIFCSLGPSDGSGLAPDGRTQALVWGT